MTVKTPAGIILLGDSQGEQLRKELLNLVKDPRTREFERLRNEGFDSETAADLAGMHELRPEARASAILEYAQQHNQPFSHDVQYVAVRETHNAVRSITSAAGAAAGTAATMSLVRLFTRHSSIIQLSAVIAGSAVLTVLATKFVAGALGTKAAMVAAANLLSASGLVALSLWKIR